MRRSLASLLILFFGLGPLTATLQTGGESRLPACCRRHGAHHCAMSDAMRSQMAGPASDSTPAFTSPSHCPKYPGSAVASPGLGHALAGAAQASPSPAMQTLSALPHRAAAPSHAFDCCAGRGPPERISL